MKIATAEIMRNLDRRAIEEYGLPGLVLMENAARGTVQAMVRVFPNLPAKRVGIFAGRGNNGGDALAVARYLINRGVTCQVYLLATRDQVKGDAATNLRIFEKMHGNVLEVPGSAEFRRSQAEMAQNDLLVDGILGTGLNSPVQGFFHEVIGYINSLRRPVIAIDIPSGLDADSGQALGICIRASLTVTFGLVKRGLVVHPGVQYCGKLVLVDISLPRAAIEEARIQDHLIEGDDWAKFLAPRKPDAHKGDFGHLLVLAGSPGKTGAATMVCQAALRVGTGLVTLGIPRSLNPILEAKITEAMTEPLPETDEQTLALKAEKPIVELSSRMKALAIGPGLSLHDETAQLVRKILGSIHLPTVIDADGLSALAGQIDSLPPNRPDLILTPHPGEMARLLRTPAAEIQRDRILAARKFTRTHGVILILKGARSIVASPEGEVFINPTGNPGMASGGMGDVLTGMVGGFLAQGFPPLEAAKLGVYLHGLVGDFVAHQRGPRGLVATDVIEQTPPVLQALACGQDRIGEFLFPLQVKMEI